MRRRRLKFPGQIQKEVAHQNGNLSPLGKEGYNRSHSIEGDCQAQDRMDEVPESAALSLGRPEGSFLSPVQEARMQSVLEAFDNGVLDTLSTMQRNCFTDVIISGDTYQDVAKRYGVSVGAVQTHVSRAAKHIRKAIGNLDE